MKKILGFFVTVCITVALFTVVSLALPVKVTENTSSGDLSALTVPSGGVFAGWFTTEDAAMALDTSFAADNDYNGAVYGAVVEKLNYGFSIPVVEFASDVKGVRFPVRFNKELKATIEGLHPLNRKGFEGTLTPKNENETGIGYGAVIALNIDTTEKLTKQIGTNVKNLMVFIKVF